MDSGRRLPEAFRSRYAIKLLAVSLLITGVIVAGGTVMFEKNSPNEFRPYTVGQKQ